MVYLLTILGLKDMGDLNRPNLTLIEWGGGQNRTCDAEFNGCARVRTIITLKISLFDTANSLDIYLKFQ